MSLNGYSWVEGNTPNMVDPSGICVDTSICQVLELINPALLPYFGCIEDRYPEPNGLCSTSVNQDILNASVMILFGEYDLTSSDCNKHNNSGCYSRASTSIGTLTDRGIWTHDHYAGPESGFRLSSEQLGSPSSFVEFRGSSGLAIHVAGENLDFEPGSSGTMIIRPKNVELGFIGQKAPILGLNSVSDLLRESSTYIQNCRDQAIRFVYNPDGYLNKNCRTWDCLTTGEVQINTNTNLSIFKEFVQHTDFDPSGGMLEARSPGDSGAGYFLGNRFIGVYQGFREIPFPLFGNRVYYFALVG